MKHAILVFVILAATAIAVSAEGMAGSASSSGSDTNSMMAPADNASNGAGSMMAPADNSMSPAGSMMTEAMYDTLKKEGKLADARMGMQLRTAMSTGMKEQFKDLMSTEKMAGKHPTVLFFTADWSPASQADLKDINANGKKLGDITIVVVDYDKSADLKKKYGITVQDTFVQIGPMGEKLAAWNGGGVQGIVDKVQKSM